MTRKHERERRYVRERQRKQAELKVLQGAIDEVWGECGDHPASDLFQKYMDEEWRWERRDVSARMTLDNEIAVCRRVLARWDAHLAEQRILEGVAEYEEILAGQALMGGP